jgi:4-amino-4-deoxy-L-arabinose transferase-like glycosyltransferase
MTTRTRSQARFWTLPTLPLLASVWLALACGWWALLRGTRYMLGALSYPAPLDGQEGMALWEAGLLRAGKGLYLPVLPEYFVSAPYPPLHPLLLALFGESSQPHVFWAGRLISVIAALLVALACYGVARQATRSHLAGLAAAVAVLAFAPVQVWALRVKPDLVGLAFTAIGLWLTTLWRAAEPTGAASANYWRLLPPSLIGAALAFTLAHFSKQTMLAGPLAAGTYLLLHDRRLALRWALLYLALIAATWATLDLVTHGQYTYHVWVLHKLQWYGSRFWKLASQLRDTWPLIVLGLVGLSATLRRPTVINAYLLWAPASLVGAGVIGSHHNHLLETGVALALAGGQAIGLALTYGGVLRVLAPVLLGTQLLLWATPLQWFAGDFELDENYTRFVDYLRATPGEVMADDVGLVYAAGRPLRYDDPAAMGPAATVGLWDQREFVALIRAEYFSTILLPIDVFQDGIIDPAGRWTPEMLQAIKETYAIKFRDSLLIYAPKSSLPPS